MTRPDSPPEAAPSPLTGGLSDGLADGFRLQHCQACGRVVYYPRVACPSCLSPDLEWRDADARGEVLSFGFVWHPLHHGFATDVPVCLCSARLRAGPVVIALLERCAPEDVRTGMAVRVVGKAQGAGRYVLRLAPER